jgi:hypothetical protein
MKREICDTNIDDCLTIKKFCSLDNHSSNEKEEDNEKKLVEKIRFKKKFSTVS